MANKREPLEPDRFYHIYNHAVGNENLFRKNENYRYFLQKYAEYINPVAETYAYCLMPNHFHFLISMKSEKELMKFYTYKYPKFSNKIFVSESDPVGFQNPPGHGSFDKIIKQNSQHFGNFFNAYVKAYNKLYQRKGSLFVGDFQRTEVKDEGYLRKLVHYVHYNPVLHDFVENIGDWKYSSYETITSSQVTSLKRKQVIEWFEDIDNFVYFHKRDIEGFNPYFD